MLRSLLNKKTLIIIGLNSGTSADALDLAAMRIPLSDSRKKMTFLAGRMAPYPKYLSRQIKAAMNNNITSVDDIIGLDRNLGIFFGEETRKFSIYLKSRSLFPDAVASHGQTVRHLPGRILNGTKKESGTFQLGHPESIAQRTGLLTIADFRQADIAAGGEGAPITCYAMWKIFSNPKENRLLVNIGGIANYFLFPSNSDVGRMKARDCGPGNSLLDIITQRYFNRGFDRDGRLAVRGKISQRLLTLLRCDNFLKGKYGSSTGRERFGEKYVEKIIRYSSSLGLNKYDILATVGELTALSIAAAIGSHLQKYRIRVVYLFGGGAKNRYLVERLEKNLPGVAFISIDSLGYNPDYLEAAAYAVMGAMALRGEPTGLPHITGARMKTVAGRIIQPS